MVASWDAVASGDVDEMRARTWRTNSVSCTVDARRAAWSDSCVGTVGSRSAFTDGFTGRIARETVSGCPLIGASTHLYRQPVRVPDEPVEYPHEERARVPSHRSSPARPARPGLSLRRVERETDLS